MKKTYLYRLAITLGLASTLSAALTGCGGGGGSKGSTVTGSSGAVQSSSPIVSNGRSVNLNTYCAWSLVS